jgi:cell division septal protein FtsQ
MWEKLLSEKHHSHERLAARRRRSHLRVLIILGSIFGILFLAAIYGLWQSPVRISQVVMYGTDQSLAESVMAAMQGSYFGIPRNSTFFVPEDRIRSLIMAAHPEIEAVSIFRNGLTGLSIKVDYRVPIAKWCGAPSFSFTATSTLISATGPCYFFDAVGFAYATTSSSLPVNAFAVYDASSTSPVSIGTTLPHATDFPAAFDFARNLATFGSPVTSLVFRDDNELDIYLTSGTRITYVLGDEQDAFTAFTSAHTNFSLANGSVAYVDLRFPGKVYVKKK